VIDIVIILQTDPASQPLVSSLIEEGVSKTKDAVRLEGAGPQACIWKDNWDFPHAV
jgi:hypothetical protein